MPRPIRFFYALLATALLWPSALLADEAVNVYSSRHYDVDDAVFERFTRETGIEINLIEGNSDALLARLRAEGNLSPADLFITVDAGRLHRAVEQELFQPIESETLARRVPASLRHPNGLWFGLTKRARVVVYDPEQIDPARIDTYEKLADPSLEGQLLVRSSSNIYNQSLVASLLDHLENDAVAEWAEGIASNLARRPQGGDTDQIRALAAGEGDFALVNHYYFARLLADEDERDEFDRLRLIFPNQDGRGTHVNVSGAGVLKNAPNRRNAVKLLEFLTSPEVQKTYAAGTFEYPVVEGVELADVLDRFGDFKSDNLDATVLGENNREATRVMDRAGWR
jgi:iron(III) transport system substrate-binding protein